jgi:hypothetical protein
VDLCFIITNIFSHLYLALVEENYPFIAVGVGVVGKSKDSHIGRQLELIQLRGSRLLPNDDDGKCTPFVVVGDKALTLSEHALWPYLTRNQSKQQ